MTKPISLSSARRRFTWSRWSLMLSVDVVSQLYLIGTGRNGRFGAVEAKGLVGKLPGNPASCQEEPCNSDPQHVLAALKVMCIFLGSVLILPLLLYYLSKLFTKLRMMCCPAKDDDESCKADEEAMVGEDLKKESNNSNNNNNNNNDARKGSKRGKSNQFSGEPNTGSKRKSQEASSISILSGNFTTNKEGLLEQSCASGAPSALLSSSNQQQSSHNHQDNYYKLSTSDDVEEFDAQSPKVGPNVVGRKQSRLKARVSLEQENDTSQSGQQQEQQQQQQKRHQSVQYQAQQRHYTNQAGKLNGAELARFSPVGHDSPGLGAPMDSPLILSEGGVLPGYNKQHQFTRTGANWSQQQQQHRQAFDVGGGGEFDQSSIEFGKTGAGQQQKQFNNFQQHRYSMYFGANGRTIGVAPGGGGNAGNYLMQNSRRANQNLANNNNTTTSGLATLTVDGRQLDRMRRSSLRSPVALEQTMLIANANNSIRRKRPPSTQNKVYPVTTTAATAVGQNQGDNDAAADGGLSHNYHHHHHHLASSLLDDRLDNSGAAAFNGQVCPAGYATQRQTNSAHLHHEQQQHEYQTQMNSTNQHIKVDTDRALSSRLELSLLAAPPVGSTAEHRHSIDGSILNNMLLNRQQSPNGRTAAQSSNEQQHRKRQQQQQQQQQLELEHYQQQQQQQLILDRDQSDGGELGVTGTGTGMGTGTGGTPLAVSLESSSGEQQKQTKANGKRRQSKAAQKRLEQLELRQAQNQLAAASQHQQYLDNARGSGANGGERNDGDDDDDGGDGDDCSGLNGGDQDQARQGGRLFGERHHRHSTVSNNNKLMAGGGHELASEVQQLADHFPHQHLPVSSQHQHQQQQQQQQYHQQQQQQQQRRPSLNTLSKPSPVRH